MEKNKKIIGSIVILISLMVLGGFFIVNRNISKKNQVIEKEKIELQVQKELKEKEIGDTFKKVEELISINEYDKAKESLDNIKNEELSEEQNKKVAELQEIIKGKLQEVALAEEKRIQEEKKKEDEEKKALEERLAEEEAKAKNVGTIANTSVAKYSNQIITVVSTGGSYAKLELWDKGSNGQWQKIDSMNARLGSGGMKYASEVYEMDKCTPTGVYTLTEAFGAAQNPGTAMSYRVLTDNDYWVDDPNSQYYNQWMTGPADGRWQSAEHLLGYADYYKYSVVIDYNRTPVIPGKSSAIFLHVDLGRPTYGCVAVAENKMVEILQWLSPEKNPHIILAMNEEELYSY